MVKEVEENKEINISRAWSNLHSGQENILYPDRASV